MRIIDACCGIGPSLSKDALLPHTPEQTLAIMDQCGIDCALAYDWMSTAQGDAVTGNTFVRDLAAQTPRFLPALSFGLDPYHTAREFLVQMQDADCRAAWLWPLHETKTAPWLYGEIFTLCEQARLPLLISSASYRPDDIAQIARDYPRLRLVLSGMDYMADAWLYPLLRHVPELRVCYGHYYIPSGGIERFVRHFGAGRLLFGSGLPVTTPGGLLGYVLYADLPQEEKALILGGNLEALMAEVRYV